MKALGSLADVERELRAAGFFAGGGDGLVADVYLGYGLARALRRTDVPNPPEPCPLPAAAVGIRRAADPAPPAGRFRVGEWEATWDEASYGAAVGRARTAIAAGDVYQVNLVQHLSAPFRGDPAGLAGALAPLRPLAPPPPARGRRSRGRSSGTAGASSPARPSSSSPGADGAPGRSRSRARGRWARTTILPDR